MAFIQQARQIILSEKLTKEEKRNQLWHVINNVNNAPTDNIAKMKDHEIKKLYSRAMKVRREIKKLLPDLQQDEILEIAGFPMLTRLGNAYNEVANIEERQERKYIPQYFTGPQIKARIMDREFSEYDTFEAMVDLMVILMLRGCEVKQIQIVEKNGAYIATNIGKTKPGEVRRIYCLYDLWDYALPMLEIVQQAISENVLPDPSAEGRTARRYMQKFNKHYDIEWKVKLPDLREIGALLFAVNPKNKSKNSEKNLLKRKAKALRHKTGGMNDFSAATMYYNSIMCPE